jgi:hypothetical protein
MATEKITVYVESEHVDGIKNLVETNKFKSEGEAARYIFNEHFSKFKKIKDIMVYIGYPILLSALMLYVAIATENVNKILIGKELFFAELTYLANTFHIIGFGIIGVLLLPGTYLYFKK